MTTKLVLTLLWVASACGEHLHLEFPYVLPFPLPPSETAAFFATPASYMALSNLPFQVGKLITPAANATASSKCGEDIRQPSTCGWYISYEGKVVQNYADYTWDRQNHTVSFTIVLDIGRSHVTERNTFRCTQTPDGQCLLHRMIAADIDGNAAALASYKSGLYFQETKELIEWVAIVEKITIR